MNKYIYELWTIRCWTFQHKFVRFERKCAILSLICGNGISQSGWLTYKGKRKLIRYFCLFLLFLFLRFVAFSFFVFAAMLRLHSSHVFGVEQTRERWVFDSIGQWLVWERYRMYTKPRGKELGTLDWMMRLHNTECIYPIFSFQFSRSPFTLVFAWPNEVAKIDTLPPACLMNINGAFVFIHALALSNSEESDIGKYVLCYLHAHQLLFSLIVCKVEQNKQNWRQVSTDPWVRAQSTNLEKFFIFAEESLAFFIHATIPIHSML